MASGISFFASALLELKLRDNGIRPYSIDAFYAAFGRPSSTGQLASSIPLKLSPTHFKHRNFNNEPHIHISCGKKKDEKSLFPVKTNAQPCSTILKQPG